MGINISRNNLNEPVALMVEESACDNLAISKIVSAIKNDGLTLDQISPNLQTFDVCMAAVEMNGMSFLDVPENQRYPEICLAAAMQNENVLYHFTSWETSMMHALGFCMLHESLISHIPDNFFTPYFCETLVKKYRQALMYIPEQFHTMDLCHIAVAQHGIYVCNFMSEIVSDRVRNLTLGLAENCDPLSTVELCMVAVKENGCALGRVPYDLRTKEVCEAAVAQHGSALFYVPSHLHTLKLSIDSIKNGGDFSNLLPNQPMVFYRAVVDHNPYHLAYVPLYMRDQEICTAAISKNGDTIKFLKKHLRTPELCMIAVKQLHCKNGIRCESALQHVPNNVANHSIYLAAVTHNGDALKYVPMRDRNTELCYAAVKQYGMAIEHVPYDFQTCAIAKLSLMTASDAEPTTYRDIRRRENVMATIQRCAGALFHINVKHRTLELCSMAIMHSIAAIMLVPERFQCLELCISAVTYNGLALYYVPKQFCTFEVCMAAVKQNARALRYVPMEIINAELCMAAIAQNSLSFPSIPNNLLTDEMCTIAVSQHRSLLPYIPVSKYTPEMLLAALKTEPVPVTITTVLLSLMNAVI